MLKYIKDEVSVVFSEIPDEITLALNISNCQFHCIGCHSPYLRENIGDELTEDVLKELILKNDGITCICFMGVGNDNKRLLELAKHVKKEYPKIKLAVYYGGDNIDDEYWELFDYIKLGPYKEEYGPLNKKTTNQRLYQKVNMDVQTFEVVCGVLRNNWTDITKKFWKD